MNLYYTNAIGTLYPGQAFIKALSETEAIQKIVEFITKYPIYKLYRTKVILGQETDEIEFDIVLNKLDTLSIENTCVDIDLVNDGTLPN